MKQLWLYTALLGCCLCCGANQANAAEAEDLVKAAFLYRFCDYVEWPATAFASTSQPLVIAVAGGDDIVAGIANTVAGRQSKRRSFEVRRYQPGDSLDGVHLLYVTDEAGFSLDQVIHEDPPPPILTVTESATSSSNAIINFTVIEQHVRFDISLRRARQSGLQLSSELLAVANTVDIGAGL